MPIARTDAKQTSYLGKLASYRRIIDTRTHKTHWGISSLLVLTLTMGERRLAEMLRQAGEDGASPAFLFEAVSELRGPYAALPQLLTEPWARAGAAALSIAESR
jgi:hypothetical protein